MGAAISLLVVLTLSVFIARIGAVALRQTGLAEGAAKFQALSAISGTGFTTKEAESVVNYPVRRRIVMFLMVVGNLGIVTVMATVVVSFVNIGDDVSAIAAQLAWLAVVLGFIWFLILNGRAERWMCDLIGRALVSTTLLGKQHYICLLQTSDGYSVCQHPVATAWLDETQAVNLTLLQDLNLQLLSAHAVTGEIVGGFESTASLNPGDSLIVYGPDAGHNELEAMSLRSESHDERVKHGHD